jgi:hypothetical protein
MTLTERLVIAVMGALAAASLALSLASCSSPAAPDVVEDVNGPDVNCSPNATYGCTCPSGLASWQQCGVDGAAIGACMCSGWDGGASHE